MIFLFNWVILRFHRLRDNWVYRLTVYYHRIFCVLFGILGDEQKTHTKSTKKGLKNQPPAKKGLIKIWISPIRYRHSLGGRGYHPHPCLPIPAAMAQLF